MTSPLNIKTTPPSLLLVILDIHPLSWSLLSAEPPSQQNPSIPGATSDGINGSAPSTSNVNPALPTPTSTNESTPLAERVPATPLHLSEFITNLLVFLNAHLASRWGNQVVFFAAAPGRSKLLYPNARVEETSVDANVYHPFRLLNAGLEEGLRAMVKEEAERFARDEGRGLNEPPALVSAMSKALCYINRHSPEGGPEREHLDTRILVVNATPGSSDSDSTPSDPSNMDVDGSSTATTAAAKNAASGNATATGAMRGGYVGLMNCVFAAQKAKVPIDVLTLPPPSTGTAPPIFLQQASHLTEGVYWRWNGKGGILQYLHTIYLPPPNLRQQPFAVPPQDAVDFRAVCFCHGDVVDIGFVCSVCLSIFCKPLPVCQMCKTKFPIKSLPNLKTLAADLTPIPVPQTIPPPKVKKDREKKGGGGGGGGFAGEARERREEIVID